MLISNGPNMVAVVFYRILHSISNKVLQIESCVPLSWAFECAFLFLCVSCDVLSLMKYQCSSTSTPLSGVPASKLDASHLLIQFCCLEQGVEWGWAVIQSSVLRTNHLYVTWSH